MSAAEEMYNHLRSDYFWSLFFFFFGGKNDGVDMKKRQSSKRRKLIQTARGFGKGSFFAKPKKIKNNKM